MTAAQLPHHSFCRITACSERNSIRQVSRTKHCFVFELFCPFPRRFYFSPLFAPNENLSTAYTEHILLANSTTIYFIHNLRYLRKKVPKLSSKKMSETERVIFILTVEIRFTANLQFLNKLFPSENGGLAM